MAGEAASETHEAGSGYWTVEWVGLLGWDTSITAADDVPDGIAIHARRRSDGASVRVVGVSVADAAPALLKAVLRA